MCTTLQLSQWNDDQTTASSGICKLDRLLKSGSGFGPGIYDLCGTVGVSSLGIYEIVFNLIIQHLINGNQILYIQTNLNIPWFKLYQNSKFDHNLFTDKIKILKINNLLELIILFNSDNPFLNNFNLILIDSFSSVYSNYLRNLKLSNLNKSNDSIIKFYESIRKFFHILQYLCFNSRIFKTILLIGKMDIFNQKILINQTYNSDNDENDNDTEIDKVKDTYINQQILVPKISLKSNLNIYFTNRIIFYRDWVKENNLGNLINGLNKDSTFLDSLNYFQNNKIKTLPHYLCITPNPIDFNKNSIENNTGFFLIDNNFKIIDIEDGLNQCYEIPDSQME